MAFDSAWIILILSLPFPSLTWMLMMDKIDAKDWDNLSLSLHFLYLSYLFLSFLPSLTFLDIFLSHSLSFSSLSNWYDAERDICQRLGIVIFIFVFPFLSSPFSLFPSLLWLGSWWLTGWMPKTGNIHIYLFSFRFLSPILFSRYISILFPIFSLFFSFSLRPFLPSLPWMLMN